MLFARSTESVTAIARVKSIALLMVISWVAMGWASSASAQGVSAKIRQQIRAVDQSILKAGQLFAKKQYAKSAKLVSEAQTAIAGLAEPNDPKTIGILEKGTYLRLEKAHGLLTAKGQTLPALAPLPDPAKASPDPKKPMPQPQADGKVSFVNQVAPILVSNCGKCHVNERRGGFSAATFGNLDNSGMIAFGVANESRLIEVMATGEMPPGNRKVAQADVAVMARWINEGANFDGPNPNANLKALANAGPAKGADRPAAVQMPTGKETVSFGLHIAPILLENCAQCHIGRNPRGDLNIANFASLMRGGDSGKLFVPGKSNASEIVLRLKGKDREVMPPSGKLDDKLIALVEKWIQEGAKFDPGDLQLELASVAAKGLAKSLDHEELVLWRKESANATWQLALNGIEPSKASTENFQLIGSGSVTKLEAIGKSSESILEEVSKVLGHGGDLPFVKGDTNLFVVGNRYDFSEFGTMVEKRTYDRSMFSSWRSDTAVAYVVLFSGLKSEPADYTVSLTRDIASVHVANWDASVPRWFADGMGYWVAAKIHRGDPAVAQWQEAAVQAMSGMQKPSDFLQKSMALEKAALVGYRAVTALEGKSSAFKKLIKNLREKKNFNSAFVDAYRISPEKFFTGQK